jgi:putative ABC transport system permease protein
LSHQLWQRRFNASAGVIGQRLALNGESYAIVGILPPDFSLWGAEVWAPGFAEGTLSNRAERSVGVIARLKPGISPAQAHAELSAIAQRLGQAYPSSNQGWGARLLPLRESWYGNDREALLALLGAAGMALAVACVNVANLLLAHAASRGRELAVRAALGASRFRLARQLLAESLLLAALGAVSGLLLAYGGLRLVVTLIPGNMLQFGIPGGAAAIRIDPAVLLFTSGIFLLTGIGFGLAPALQGTRTKFSSALKEGGRNATSRFNLNQLLVVAEIALALMLLVGAGLMTRSLARLESLDRGFNLDNVLNLYVSLPPARYQNDSQRADFFTRALERIQALPGVEVAGASALLSARGRAFVIPDRPEPQPGQEPKAIHRVISPGYLQAVGIPLYTGRDFKNQDSTNAPRVCLINQNLARRYWPDEDPVGKQISLPNSSFGAATLTIVGVVGDVKEALDPRAPLSLEPQPTLYCPYLQAPTAGMQLAVRTGSAPLSLAAALRTEIWALDKELPVSGLRAARESLAESVARPRFNTLLLGCFAAVSLLLAVVGVYGVMAHSVSRRIQDIGIRLALGAQRRDIIKLVLGQGLKLTVIGLGLGLAGATALTRVIANQLYDVAATDVMTFAVTSLALLTVALLACYVPARRATKVDPMIALRSEY